MCLKRPGGELLGEGRMAMDKQAWPQGADEGEGVQEPLGGAFVTAVEEHG
jgi:hypothetical protein